MRKTTITTIELNYDDIQRILRQGIRKEFQMDDEDELNVEVQSIKTPIKTSPYMEPSYEETFKATVVIKDYE